MAGHSHFKNIKRKKEAEDRKKAMAFSRFSRLIISSVREKGKDPESNPSLKTVIEKAKEADMPKENIEKAIKRGAGEGEEGRLEEFLVEAYGPEGVAFIVKGYTDNKNRNLGEIKDVLKKHNGKIADPGSVKWLFDVVGVLEVEKGDESTLLSLIEAGIDDFREKEDFIILYTPPKETEEIKKKLIAKNIRVTSAFLGFKPKNPFPSPFNKHISLCEDLLSCENVEEVYFNTT